MIISGLIILLVIIGMIIPSKYIYVYICFGCVVMYSLYLRISPDSSIDIYRHFETMEIYRQMGIRDLFGNSKYALSLSNNPIFIIYIFLISRFQRNQLLPFITSLIIYLFPVLIAKKYIYDASMKKWKIMFLFLFLFSYGNFFSVTGIRNDLAFSIFAVVLYLDCVIGWKRYICGIIYALLCLIHPACVMLIGIRCVLFFYKKETKLAIQILMLFAVGLIPALFNQFGGLLFSQEGFFQKVFSIFVKYQSGVMTEYHTNRAIFMFCIYMLYMAIVIYCNKYSNFSAKYEKYNSFVVLLLLFTIGNINQYDTFLRMNFALMPLMFFIVFHFFKENVGEKMLSIHGKNKNSVRLGFPLLILIYIGAIISLAVFIYAVYIPVDHCFK